ncbi:MAG TPA: dTDP-4-dehydrorhamnose reductase [Vicinamibacteria bacterium]
MRYLVTGAAGQLGQALVAHLGARCAWSGGRDALDVTDPRAVARLVTEVAPDVVVNASAYNAVDAAETDVAAAMAVNALGPRHLAEACRAAGAVLVHVSTDYVFDGRRREPYGEDDATRPLSVYGTSKLAGELLVAASDAAHLIVRTSGVFGRGGSRSKGGSFVERVVARAAAGEPLRVVDDQVFAPTYAPDLARALVSLVESGARGLFHVAGGGIASWHELATAALSAAGVAAAVERIASEALAAPAERPAYSVLDTGRYRALGLPPLRHWREALAEMLAGQSARR